MVSAITFYWISISSPSWHAPRGQRTMSACSPPVSSPVWMEVNIQESHWMNDKHHTCHESTAFVFLFHLCVLCTSTPRDVPGYHLTEGPCSGVWLLRCHKRHLPSWTTNGPFRLLWVKELSIWPWLCHQTSLHFYPLPPADPSPNFELNKWLF